MYEDTDSVYLFMDFLEGGELLDRICMKSFTEREASEVLEKIASTIKYLHENGVRTQIFDYLCLSVSFSLSGSNTEMKNE